MNAEQVPEEWTGRTVAVSLTTPEAQGIEITAKLQERGATGITLSETDELGVGPTIFCPWESVHDVLLIPPEGLEALPDDEEAEETNAASEEPPSASARTLERVIPVAQKLTTGETTLAIASLEVYENGLGVLRWQLSFGEDLTLDGADSGIPEPWFEVRDETGRALSWTPRGAGASEREADGETQVEGLPESGELEVKVERLVTDVYDDGMYRETETLLEGPWTFRFSL